MTNKSYKTKYKINNPANEKLNITEVPKKDKISFCV